MTVDHAIIADEAIAWHIRHGDMGEHDWHAFIAWLEQSPEHAAAYDRVALRDVQVPALLARDAKSAAVRFDTPRTRRWLWAGAGSAIAAMLVVAVMPAGQPSIYSVATAAGERHQLTLSDGTRVEMNGATRLEFDRNNPRNVTIAAGEAMFTVKHAAVPFRVHAGDMVIEDLGTVFNVARAAKRVDVQVAEGAVRFDPQGASIDLAPGRTLSTRLDTNEVVLDKVDTASVGGWRTGRLQFRETPVAMVVDAIARQSGIRIDVGPELSARPFTGMIVLSGNAAQDVPRVAALMGAKSRRDGERWVLSPDLAPTP